MFNVEDVTKYILANRGEEEEISHLKLQKLLYYCQGFSLAIYNKPLFKESIRHWDHGPVVPDIYYAYKNHGANNLPVPDDFDATTIDDANKELINEVLTVYGQFSAWKLRDMTHDEPPWAGTDDNEEISHEILKDYFSTQINI